MQCDNVQLRAAPLLAFFPLQISKHNLWFWLKCQPCSPQSWRDGSDIRCGSPQAGCNNNRGWRPNSENCYVVRILQQELRMDLAVLGSDVIFFKTDFIHLVFPEFDVSCAVWQSRTRGSNLSFPFFHWLSPNVTSKLGWSFSSVSGGQKSCAGKCRFESDFFHVYDTTPWYVIFTSGLLSCNVCVRECATAAYILHSGASLPLLRHV